MLRISTANLTFISGSSSLSLIIKYSDVLGYSRQGNQEMTIILSQEEDEDNDGGDNDNDDGDNDNDG